MYQVTADAGRRIVRAELSGFFSLEEVEAFARAEQAAARSLGVPSGSFALLVCAEDGIAQSQDVLAGFGRLLTDMPLKAGRVAIVSGSALLRMQLRRALTGERVGVFASTAEASAWIDRWLAETRPTA